MNILQIAMIILGILSALLGGICTIFGAYKMFSGKSTSGMMISGIFSILVAGFLLYGAIDYIPKHKEKEQQEKQHYQQALESYTWYLDGEQVDPKTISLSNYRKEYNDNDKIVVLSPDNANTKYAMFPLICFFIMVFSFMIRKANS